MHEIIWQCAKRLWHARDQPMFSATIFLLTVFIKHSSTCMFAELMNHELSGNRNDQGCKKNCKTEQAIRKMGLYLLCRQPLDWFRVSIMKALIRNRQCFTKIFHLYCQAQVQYRSHHFWPQTRVTVQYVNCNSVKFHEHLSRLLDLSFFYNVFQGHVGRS